MGREGQGPYVTVAFDGDLRIDLNTMDETGLPWTFLDQAPDPSRIVPGRHIVVGSGAAVAVAVVVDITDEGIVHVPATQGLGGLKTHAFSNPILHRGVCQIFCQIR